MCRGYPAAEAPGAVTVVVPPNCNLPGCCLLLLIPGQLQVAAGAQCHSVLLSVRGWPDAQQCRHTCPAGACLTGRGRCVLRHAVAPATRPCYCRWPWLLPTALVLPHLRGSHMKAKQSTVCKSPQTFKTRHACSFTIVVRSHHRPVSRLWTLVNHSFPKQTDENIQTSSTCTAEEFSQHGTSCSEHHQCEYPVKPAVPLCMHPPSIPSASCEPFRTESSADPALAAVTRHTTRTPSNSA